ncbi:MAG: MFS transporter [Candidatus Komeilibacteria bacterium]|nr:MFS transporter [Candidatus Komeilibacteria bacterium]
MADKVMKIFLWISFATTFFIGLHFAVYVQFLLSHRLTLAEVALVNMAYMLSVFVLEVPTGAIADIFGRKFSFVLSCVMGAVGFIVYGLSTGISGFVAAEIIIAISTCLKSGAFHAWIVDSLAHYQWQGELTTVFRREQRYVQPAALIGGLLGAQLAVFGLFWPFLLGGIGYLIVLVMAVKYMREDYFVRAENIQWWPNMRQLASDSIRYGWREPIIFLVLLMAVLLTFGIQPVNMYWQPLFGKFFHGPEALGYIWAGVVIFSWSGAEMAAKFTKVFARPQVGYIVIGIGLSLGIFLVALASNNLWLCALGFFWHEIWRGIYRPYNSAILHARLPSRQRATVDSFVSMIGTGAAAVGLLIFGQVADEIGVSGVWLGAAIFLLITPFFLLVPKRCNSKIPNEI